MLRRASLYTSSEHLATQRTNFEEQQRWDLTLKQRLNLILAGEHAEPFSETPSLSYVRPKDASEERRQGGRYQAVLKWHGAPGIGKQLLFPFDWPQEDLFEALNLHYEMRVLVLDTADRIPRRLKEGATYLLPQVDLDGGGWYALVSASHMLYWRDGLDLSRCWIPVPVKTLDHPTRGIGVVTPRPYNCFAETHRSSFMGVLRICTTVAEAAPDSAWIECTDKLAFWLGIADEPKERAVVRTVGDAYRVFSKHHPKWWKQ